MNDKVKRYFIVMSNIFTSGHEIHLRYDLKGSVYGRRTNPLEDHSIARKDLDFSESGMKIKLGPERKERLMQQLYQDCQFFVHNDIIDYSLLIGIHHLRDQHFPQSGFLRSEDGSSLYFLGVIDILTVYNKKKKLEQIRDQKDKSLENLQQIMSAIQQADSNKMVT